MYPVEIWDAPTRILDRNFHFRAVSVFPFCVIPDLIGDPVLYLCICPILSFPQVFSGNPVSFSSAHPFMWPRLEPKNPVSSIKNVEDDRLERDIPFSSLDVQTAACMRDSCRLLVGIQQFLMPRVGEKAGLAHTTRVRIK